MVIIKRRNLIKALAVLCCLLGLAVVVLPWKSWLADKLMASLEANGLQNVHLTVSRLGFKRIVLKDISIGRDPPLTFERLTIGYSLPELWSGNLHELTMQGLTLEARRDHEKWVIAGLEKGMGVKSNTPASLPVTSGQFAAIPFEAATLTKSTLRVISTPWQLDIPLHMEWQKAPTPKLTYQADALRFKMQDLEAETGSALLEAALSEADKQWKGRWLVKDMRLKGMAIPVPVMQGNGTLMAEADHVAVQGQFKSADDANHVQFSVNYTWNAPEKSAAIVAFALPWNGGIVSARNVRVPFSGKQPVTLDLKVERVSVDALMQSLTGKRASGTGIVSGTLPLTIAANGTFILHDGTLQAEEPGVIRLAPDAIPGDNEKIALVRDVLKDLHYTLLSLTMNNDKNNKLSALITLEGRNPDVYAGKPVKLNVHLTGDVLNFMQQSMMMANPNTLLRQDGNAKK